MTLKLTGATLALTLCRTALTTLGAYSEGREILQSAGNSAGDILALTTGRALPNQLPSMVYGRGLLLGSGVRAMSIVCSTCAITGNRICLHTNAGDSKED